MRIPEKILCLGGSTIKMVQYLVYHTLQQFSTVVTMLWPKVLGLFEVVLNPGFNSQSSVSLLFSVIQPSV